MERIPYRFCCSYYSLNNIYCETLVHLNGSVRPLQEEVYDQPPNAVDGSGEMKTHFKNRETRASHNFQKKNWHGGQVEHDLGGDVLRVEVQFPDGLQVSAGHARAARQGDVVDHG